MSLRRQSQPDFGMCLSAEDHIQSFRKSFEECLFFYDVLEESQKEWEKSIGSSERRRRVFPDWLIDMSDSISNKDQTDK